MLPILVLVLATGISGNVISSVETKLRPLFTVFGNHYDPISNWSHINDKIVNGQHLREKYFKMLNKIVDKPKENKINEILNDMEKLTTDRSLKDVIKCCACKIGIKLYKFLKCVEISIETIVGVLESACIDFQISTPKICKSTLDQYGSVIATIIDRGKTNAETTCSMLLNLKCGGNLKENVLNVTLPLNSKLPVFKPLPPPNFYFLEISGTINPKGHLAVTTAETIYAISDRPCVIYGEL